MELNKLVVVGNTGGSLFSKLVMHNFFKEMIYEVVSEGDGNFNLIAKREGLKSVKIQPKETEIFSDLLNKRYEKTEDKLFLFFYDKLLKGDIFEHQKGRLINIHTTLLPSFPGLNAFDNNLKEISTLFMGCSLHIIDQGVDTGASLMQAAIPLNRKLLKSENRHKIFLLQYYCVLQVTKWLLSGRITLNKNKELEVGGGIFLPSVFAPNLDDDFFQFIGEPENSLNNI
jgi:folate-dependent phosphoribosylglycinamide formyltransferase PurN